MTGICLYKPEKDGNLASLVRTCFNFKVDFICTVENKYKRCGADTPNTAKHVPIFHFKTWENFLDSKPNCDMVSLEVNNSTDIRQFQHPKNAIYIFGGESQTLPDFILNDSHRIRVETNRCLNLAVCGGIVLYDRSLKS